jgi:diguanylate cyclase (GGDEF)-like protein
MTDQTLSRTISSILVLLLVLFPVSFYLVHTNSKVPSAEIRVMQQTGFVAAMVRTVTVTSIQSSMSSVDKAIEVIEKEYVNDPSNRIDMQFQTPEELFVSLKASWNAIKAEIAMGDKVSSQLKDRCLKDIKRLSRSVMAVAEAKQQRGTNTLYAVLLLCMLLTLALIYFVRKYINAHQKQDALTDRVTKLYNRVYFLDEFSNACARANRNEEPLSVIFFAIDGFEQYRLELRDELISQFGRILMPLTRSSDVACRIGENEFVIIAPKTEAQKVQILLERIRKSVEKDMQVDGRAVTISAGIIQYRLKEESQSCILRAEKAMLEARKYRNRVIVQE